MHVQHCVKVLFKCFSKSLSLCHSHREHQEAVDELKRKSERNKTLLEEENKKLQADIDKVCVIDFSLVHSITYLLKSISWGSIEKMQPRKSSMKPTFVVTVA